MNDIVQKVGVGVGVVIWKDGKILMGKRKKVTGDGYYALPGGHLEYGESFEDCARREIKEETGLEVGEMRFQCVATDNSFLHDVVLTFACDWKSGEPENVEPDINESWSWYSLDEIPQPVFAANRM